MPFHLSKNKKMLPVPLLIEPQNGRISLPVPVSFNNRFHYALVVRNAALPLEITVPVVKASGRPLRLMFSPAYNINNINDWETQFAFDEDYTRNNKRQLVALDPPLPPTYEIATYFAMGEHSGWYEWEARNADGTWEDISIIAVEGLRETNDPFNLVTQQKSFTLHIPVHLSDMGPPVLDLGLNNNTEWNVTPANEAPIVYANVYPRTIVMNKLGQYTVQYRQGPYRTDANPNGQIFEWVNSHLITHYTLHYFRFTSLTDACHFYRAPSVDNRGEVVAATRVTGWRWNYGSTDPLYIDRSDDQSATVHYNTARGAGFTAAPGEVFHRSLANDLAPTSNTIVVIDNFFETSPHIYLVQWILETQYVNVPFFGATVRLEIPPRDIPDFHTVSWTAPAVKTIEVDLPEIPAVRAFRLEVKVLEASDLRTYVAKFVKIQGDQSASFGTFTQKFVLVHDRPAVDYNIDRALINNPVINALAKNRGFGFGTLDEAAIFAGEYPYIVQYGRSLYNVLEQYSHNPRVKFVPTLPKELEVPGLTTIKLTEKVFPPVIQYVTDGDFVVFHPQDRSWVNLVSEQELPRNVWPETNEWVDIPASRYRTEPLFSAFPPTTTLQEPVYFSVVLGYYILGTIDVRPEDVYEDLVTQLFKSTSARYQPTSLGKLCAIPSDFFPQLDLVADHFSSDDLVFIKNPNKVIPTRSQYLSALAKSISFQDLKREFMIVPRARLMTYPAPTKESVKSLSSAFRTIVTPARTFEDFYESTDATLKVQRAVTPPPPIAYAPVAGGAGLPPPAIVRRGVTWWKNRPDLDALLTEMRERYENVLADPNTADDVSDAKLLSDDDDVLTVVLKHLLEGVDDQTFQDPQYIQGNGNLALSLLQWVTLLRNAVKELKTSIDDMVAEANVNPPVDLLGRFYNICRQVYVTSAQIYDVKDLDTPVLVYFQFLSEKFSKFAIYFPEDLANYIHVTADRLLDDAFGYTYYTRVNGYNSAPLDPSQLIALDAPARPYDFFIRDLFEYCSDDLDVITLGEYYRRIVLKRDVTLFPEEYVFSEFNRYRALQATVEKAYPYVMADTQDFKRAYQDFINKHDSAFIARQCKEDFRQMKRYGSGNDFFNTVPGVKSIDKLNMLFTQFTEYLTYDYDRLNIDPNLPTNEYLSWHFLEFLKKEKGMFIRQYFAYTEQPQRTVQNFSLVDLAGIYDLFPLNNFLELDFNGVDMFNAAKMTPKATLFDTIVKTIKLYFSNNSNRPVVVGNATNDVVTIIRAYGRPIHKFIDWVHADIFPPFIEALFSNADPQDPLCLAFVLFNFVQVTYAEYAVKNTNSNTQTRYQILYEATNGTFFNGNPIFTSPYDTFVENPIPPTDAEKAIIVTNAKTYLGLTINAVPATPSTSVSPPPPGVPLDLLPNTAASSINSFPPVVVAPQSTVVVTPQPTVVIPTDITSKYQFWYNEEVDYPNPTNGSVLVPERALKSIAEGSNIGDKTAQKDIFIQVTTDIKKDAVISAYILSLPKELKPRASIQSIGSFLINLGLHGHNNNLIYFEAAIGYLSVYYFYALKTEPYYTIPIAIFYLIFPFLAPDALRLAALGAKDNDLAAFCELVGAHLVDNNVTPTSSGTPWPFNRSYKEYPVDEQDRIDFLYAKAEAVFKQKGISSREFPVYPSVSEEHLAFKRYIAAMIDPSFMLDPDLSKKIDVSTGGRATWALACMGWWIKMAKWMHRHYTDLYAENLAKANELRADLSLYPSTSGSAVSSSNSP